MALSFNPAATPTSAGAPAEQERVFEHLPIDTIVDVVVERISIKPLDKSLTWNKNKSWDEEVSFGFKPVDDDIRKRCGWFWDNVPAILDNSSNCKLRLYLQSILGVDDLATAFPDGFEFEPEDFKNQFCQVRLGTYFSKKKQQIVNSVEDVLPATTGGEAIAPEEAF